MGGERNDPTALPPGKKPGTHCIGAWVGPRAFWTGAENIAPKGIRSPARSARSESLYQLSYLSPNIDTCSLLKL